MATARNYSNTASQAALSAAIAATDTSIALTNFSGYPVAPFTAALARGTANEEIVLVTAVAANTVTVTRGYDGTSAKAQGAGTTFQEVAVALDFRDANTHVVATTGVHGVTGAVVGTTDVQTLTNKTLTSPSSSNPTDTGTSTIATASVTTLNVSGVSTLASVSATSGSFSSTLNVTGAADFGTLATFHSSIAQSQLAGAPTAPAAGTIKKFPLTDGGYYVLDSASLKRRLGQVWASATSFPAAPMVGDIVLRTDVGTNGTIYTYVGAGGASGWVAEGPCVATSTTRPTAGLYEGFQLQESDTHASYTYANSAWQIAPLPGAWTELANATYLYTLTTTQFTVLPAINGTSTFTVTVPTGRTCEVELVIPRTVLIGTCGGALRIMDGANLLDGVDLSSSNAGNMVFGQRLRGFVIGDGASHTLTPQGWSTGGTVQIGAGSTVASSVGPFRFRYRIY